MSPSSLGPDEVYYPDSDGQPLGDNDWQFTAILAAVATLRVHFAERPDVYVFGDMFIYYVEGDPERSVAPDVCVSFGVPKHKRMVCKLWEEGKAPDFVMGWRRRVPGGTGARRSKGDPERRSGPHTTRGEGTGPLP